jgi:hypothetical protein
LGMCLLYGLAGCGQPALADVDEEDGRGRIGGRCCQPLCPAGQVLCGHNCYDLRADPFNCGVCGNRCGGDEWCQEGVCVPASCGVYVACGNECCGTSGVCEQRCLASGSCTPSCVFTGYVPCGGSACRGTNEVCEDDVCHGPPCNDRRRTSCDGVCVDLTSNPNHCGGCDHRCRQDQACRGGRCIDRACGSLSPSRPPRR